MPILRASCCSRVGHRRGFNMKLITATLCALGMYLGDAYAFGHGLHHFARMSRGCDDDVSCRKDGRRTSWLDLLGRGPSASVERYISAVS